MILFLLQAQVKYLDFMEFFIFVLYCVLNCFLYRLDEGELTEFSCTLPWYEDRYVERCYIYQRNTVYLN